MPLIQDLNVDQLKLPLGFIKIPQLVLAVIAFTARSGWRWAVSYKCDSKTIISKTIDSFDLREKFEKCGNAGSDVVLDVDHSAAAAFFGMIALISIIYTLIALYVYLFKWGTYAGDECVPKLDLIATSIIAIWWFLATWIWWRTTNTLKDETDSKTIEQRFNSGKFCPKSSSDKWDSCDFVSYTDYATLTVSVIAGFGCLILWASNIYYAFKETVWFASRKPTPSAMNSTGFA